MVDEEDAGVGFEVDPLYFADDFEAFDRDVFLVG